MPNGQDYQQDTSAKRHREW